MCDPIKEAVLLPEFLWILLVGITVLPQVVHHAFHSTLTLYLLPSWNDVDVDCFHRRVIPEGGLYQLFVIINSKPLLVYYSAFSLSHS